MPNCVHKLRRKYTYLVRLNRAKKEEERRKRNTLYVFKSSQSKTFDNISTYLNTDAVIILVREREKD